MLKKISLRVLEEAEMHYINWDPCIFNTSAENQPERKDSHYIKIIRERKINSICFRH